MEWKSTTKVLPKRSQYCLCVYNGELPFVAYYVEEDEDFLTNHKQKYPTHWMDLPKPPKGKTGVVFNCEPIK